jgi:hypothetical protein
MKQIRLWGKALLWLHLFVCCVWLVFFRSLFYGKPDPEDLPFWVFHIVAWSIMGVQFTWGLTIGLLVGPSRQRRDMLWWSLLTIFFPLKFFVFLRFLPIGIVYLAFAVIILACETYGGVLLGAKLHSEVTRED